MAKVLVTGAAGFIGGHLADALIERGHEVVGIDDLSRGSLSNVNPLVTFHKLSITDLSDIIPLFHGVDAVFHLAALARVRPSMATPVAYNKVNLTGTLNVLEASRLSGVKHFIFASSSSVFGDTQLPTTEDNEYNPQNPYALQKALAEQYVRFYDRVYGIPTTILRFFNVYGPRQILGGAYSTVIGTFLSQKKAGLPLTIFGDGNQRRDFTHVRDTVDACLLVLEQFASGSYNVGRGSNISVQEIANMISDDQIYLPEFPNEARETLCDNTKARNVLGWKPQIDADSKIIEEMECHAYSL